VEFCDKIQGDLGILDRYAFFQLLNQKEFLKLKNNLNICVNKSINLSDHLNLQNLFKKM
jgi:hypothetical protein